MSQDAKDQLLGRRPEVETLDRLLSEVRGGRSRVLVLRGEAGIGKSTLLDHVAAQAHGMRIIRVAGTEAEADFAYAALQQLCTPVLSHLDRLPRAQQDALRIAFGLGAGNPPEVLLVGLALLGLFSEAAAESPLVCLVDDAQWLDPMSQQILAFVARRLDAESVALVFAERVDGDGHRNGNGDGDRDRNGDRNGDGNGNGNGNGQSLAGLPDLPLRGLADVDARALLEEVLTGPVEARVRDRIVAETGGNPLALLELPRGLSSAELAFGFGGPGVAPLASRVEEGFRQRIEALPSNTRLLLLTAAVEPAGDERLLWQALSLLGVKLADAVPAEAAGLIEPGPPVRFRHPLVRSAAWRGADTTMLGAVHGALAGATDADRDPDRHAWHLAHAAIGPDEDVAAALERSADRAMARGGRSAAASFLERAAALTPDSRSRVRRALAAAWAQFDAGAPTRVAEMLAIAELGPQDRQQQADAARLRAKASFLVNPGLGAVGPLLAATAQLTQLDPVAARETCLTAFGAAVRAGRLDEDGIRRVAEAARALPHGDEVAGLFLRALATWALDGSTAAAPLLAQALRSFTADPDLGLLWVAANTAQELGDLQTWSDITDQAVRSARATGTLSVLPIALGYRASAVGFAGRFSEAWDLLSGVASDVTLTGPATLQATKMVIAAHQGWEQTTLDLVEAVERDCEQRGIGQLVTVTGYARSVLHNGLGNYPAALRAARRAAEFRDLSVHNWILSELVEAATRAGDPDVAAWAREELATWSHVGTPWAIGALAVADAVTGVPEQAEGHYREAIDHFSRGGLAAFEARTRLLLGEWLRRRNRRAAARIELRAAHEACTTMNMEAFAERARRELLATGETVRKRTVVGDPVLTPQETQIARLAADGHSNAEIGAELFLSSRTVEWHMRKVLAKLGISSRRELNDAWLTDDL